jgi:phage terminase large subunit GpA-like protein
LKRVAGVRIRLAHAGSSVALKSDPCALALIDEYDAMQKDVQHSGDPLALISARGDTYADFVAGITSTPSLGHAEVYRDEPSGLDLWKHIPAADLESPIWKLWQEGTRAHWAWPCLFCGEYFVPRFDFLRWDDPVGRKVTPIEAGNSAHVACPHCGGIHTDAEHKREMNARGRYVAPGQVVDTEGNVTGSPPATTTASFWVSGLCSPFISWSQRAADYVLARRLADPERIRTSRNASFGELYRPGRGHAPELVAVANHKTAYHRGEVPSWVRLLVLSCDVQRSQIYWVLRGWDSNSTSALINYGTIWGSTTEEGCWIELAEFIRAPYACRRIERCLIDYGFRPGKVVEIPFNRVHDFARRLPNRVRLTKGASQPQKALLKKSQTEGGLKLFLLDTDRAKLSIYEKIDWPTDVRGAWLLPGDVEDDYLRQMISETRTKTPAGRVTWRAHGANHYWDAECMQMVVPLIFNLPALRPPPAPPAAPPTEPLPPEQLTAPAPALAPDTAEEKKWEKWFESQESREPGGSGDRWNRRW